MLPARLRDQIGEHAETAYPGEACGALLGRSAGSDLPTVTRAIPLPNSAPPGSDGYRIDPDLLYGLSPGTGDQEDGLVGIYHSHPDRAAGPSETDLRHGIPGLLYTAVSVRSGRAGARAAWVIGPADPADARKPTGGPGA
jgi:proteasome lid subunit RPN8/RPN11